MCVLEKEPWGSFIVFREGCKAFSKGCGISSACISVKNFLTQFLQTLHVGAHAFSVLAHAGEGDVPASAWLGFMHAFSLPKHHLNLRVSLTRP